MALTIDGATHGYDANNVQTLKNNINVKCVSETVAAINLGLTTLRTEVDNAWVGASAEKFKEKMEQDANEVSKAIQTAGEQCISFIDGTVGQMAEVDESITF